MKIKLFVSLFVALFVALVVALVGAAAVRGQSALDGFDPNANGPVRAIVVQADGKIIIGGEFTSVSPNGGPAVTRNRIARFNPNGTLDTAFNPNASNVVNSIAVQADGKILVGGFFTGIGGLTRNRLARLDATSGSADSFDPNANGAVWAIALQEDGKILAGGEFTTVGGQSRRKIARLDAGTGLADSFDPNVSGGDVWAITVQEDGKILVGGSFASALIGQTTIGGQPRDHLARLDATSGLADSFNPSPNDSVHTIAVQADGKVLAGGHFTAAGGQARNHIARLNSNGTLDMGFDPDADADVLSIVVQSDGQILLGGAFTRLSGQSRYHIAHLNATGTLDNLFFPDPHANNFVSCMAVQSDGKILVGGAFTVVGGETPFPPGVPRNRIARLESDGKVDQTLNSSVVGNFVNATAVQPDGKILIGGSFTQVLGEGRANLARLNTDGTLDTGFFANTDGLVTSLAVQADGRILVGGQFTNIQGSAHKWFARLSTSGTPDGTFNPNVNSQVLAIAVQSDGRIVIGGNFNSLGGQTRHGLARLLSGGTLDNIFDPNAVYPSGDTIVYSVALQPDGKILAAGVFTTVGGVPRNFLARLDATTGSPDSFNPNPDDFVYAIAAQTDGKILVGGRFLNIGGQTHHRIARLNSDGTADPDFNPNALGEVYSIIVQADGKVLAAGKFFSLGGFGNVDYLARLDAVTGTQDSFKPNASDIVRAIALQADGKVLAGGVFTSIGGTNRNRFARLSNDTAAFSDLKVTQTFITLTQGGSAPQFTHVSFGSDYEFDGTFGFVGNGTPQGSSYTLTGLNLRIGTNFLIRSRGYFRTGYLNGSETTEYNTRNVFLIPPPQPLLNIQHSAPTNVVLSWATNFTGFTLEANTNLTTIIWSTVSPAPAVNGTNNVVTNAASDSARFYRLRKP